jgi:aryl-alcohol dehydrogenase-like predicted oxidoreductase
VAAVSQLAEVRGIGRAQVALAWVMAQSAITAPIVGATKPHHLADAIAALDVTLTADEIAMLEAPYVPHPVNGIVPPLSQDPPKLTLTDA